MKRIILTLAVAAVAIAAPRAQAPASYVYAITGARVVPVSGAVIETGTVVVRDGLIAQVGPGATAPAGAQVIDGKGLTVYPGLIDMGSTAGLEPPQQERGQPGAAATRSERGGVEPQTSEDVERAKLELMLRSQLRAADYMNPTAATLARVAAVGITSILAAPAGDAIRGQSALVNTALPPDDPQIGALADERRGALVVRTPVALHVSFAQNPGGGNAYPNSLMGVIAFVRQQFLDAQHYQTAVDFAAKNGKGTGRPAYKAAYEAMQPALAAKLPVAFRAETSREISRALDMAKSFKLDPIITAGFEADQITADLKAANARVIYSLNYPTRAVSIAPDADEPLSLLRARANAPKTPAALDKAGVLFAFESGGLSEPKDFIKNAAKAVQNGLSRDAALKALTLNAATIAGAAERVGSIETGKIANLLITEGDLFDEKMTIKHVFVDGRPVRLDPPAPAPARSGQ
jgi:imidazolonepropionase-like amidohydrolase